MHAFYPEVLMELLCLQIQYLLNKHGRKTNCKIMASTCEGVFLFEMGFIGMCSLSSTVDDPVIHLNTHTTK